MSTKQLRNHCGNPIRTANKNPILDTRMYEVEFADGFKQAVRERDEPYGDFGRSTFKG